MKRLQGIFTDCDPVDQPEGTYRDAQNIDINDKAGALVTERGTSLQDSLPAGNVPIGHILLHDQRVVIFSAGSSSQIGVYAEGIYSPIYTDIELNFSKDLYIQGTSKINPSNEEIIYWTDGVNPPRYLNIDNLPVIEEIDDLNIFTNFTDVPQLTLNQVNDYGGSLLSGSYQFALRYVDLDGNTTNFITITDPIDVVRLQQKGINDEFFVEGNPLQPTGKSISLSLKNLNSKYEQYQLAVVRYENGTIGKVQLIQPIGVSGIEDTYIYTGNEATIDGSMEEILINNASYRTAKSLTQVDGTLYMANLTREEQVRYQQFANAIHTSAITKTVDEADKAEGISGDGTLSYFNKSFKRGEPYAFYISFVLKDGTETRAFHIPGRSSRPLDLSDASSTSTYFDNIDPTAKFFHLLSSPDVNGMDYWENENETYPDTEDWITKRFDSQNNEVSGEDLRGKPVRHHKFGDELTFPPVIGSVNGGKNSKVSILGVKFTGIELPVELKNKVRRIKFYHARKTLSNSLVLDQSLAIPNVLYNDKWANYAFPSGANSGTAISDTFSFYPFSSLVKDTSLASVVYGKIIARAKRTAMQEYGDNLAIHAMNADYDPPLSYSDKFAKINGIARIPADTDDVTLTNLGFNNNKNSSEEEGHILAKFDKNITTNFDTATSDGNGEMGNILALMQYKKEVFAPFDQQELVPMGDFDGDFSTNSPKQFKIKVLNPAPAGTGVYGLVEISIGGVVRTSYEIQLGDSVNTIGEALKDNLVIPGYTVTSVLLYHLATDSYNYIITLDENVYDSNNTDTISVTTGATLFSDIGAVEETSDTSNDVPSIDIFSGDTFICRSAFRVSDKRQATTLRRLFYTTVESYDNIAYRQSGEEFDQLNPNNPTLGQDILHIENSDSAKAITDYYYDNYLAYDLAHSEAGHRFVKTTPYSKNFREVTQFPERVVRGRQDNLGDFEDSFRVFLESDYLDFPKNRGQITNLESVNNILMVHMERGLYRTRGREELTTDDFRAFLGSGDIFSVKPSEMSTADEGFAGLQDSKASVVTIMGYMFVDQEAKKVFSLRDNIQEISDRGVRNFFTKNLQWFIDKADKGIHKKVLDCSIDMEYDPYSKRILLTKRDWEPTDALLATNIGFNETTGKITSNGVDVNLSDATYFTDRSFTISYLTELDRWVSYHSYKPFYYFRDLDTFYSFDSNNIHAHNGDYCQFYGVMEPMIYEFVENEAPQYTKLLQNIEYTSYVYNENDRIIHDKTFDKLRVSNELQDTGELPIVYFTEINGNARNVGHTWKINKFRDLVDPITGNIDPNLPFHKQKKFTGKYAKIRLSYTPDLGDSLRLIRAHANFKPHRR